jgi:DNA-binding IscR family transcriptional regulator
VDGAAPAFVCTEIRQRGPLAASPDACRLPCAVHKAMLAADAAWRDSLRSVTIADIARSVTDTNGPQVIAGIRGWLTS